MSMGMPAEEQPLTLKDLLSNYLALAKRGLKYWKRGLLLFLLVATAGMVWVVNRPRVYRSEAKFEVLEIDDRSDMGQEERQRSVEARIDQVWNSRRFVLQLVADQHLYDHLRGITSDAKIAELFTSAMDRRVDRNVVSVGFVYKDPERAQQVVTSLIDLFRNARRNATAETARLALNEVNLQVQQLEQELARKQQALDEFIMANQAMVEQLRQRRQGGPAGAQVAAPRAPEPIDARTSARTRQLRARIAQLRQNLESLRNPGSESRPSADEPQELRDARERLAAKQAEVRAMSVRGWTLEHPAMAAASRELATMRAEVEAMSRRHRGQIENQANLSASERQRRIDDVQRDIREAEEQLAVSVRSDNSVAQPQQPTQPTQPVVPVRNPLTRTNLTEVESEYDRLNTDVSATRTSYTEMFRRKLEKQAELRRTETSGGERIRIIDPPSRPIEPEPPGRTKLSAIVMFVALLLGAGTALVSGFIDTRIYDSGDLQRWGELPELPFIPDLFVDLPDGGARLAAQAAAQGPPAGGQSVHPPPAG